VVHVERAAVLLRSLAADATYSVTTAHPFLDAFPAASITEYSSAAPPTIAWATQGNRSAVLIGTGQAAKLLAPNFVDSNKHDAPARGAHEFGAECFLISVPAALTTPDSTLAGERFPAMAAEHSRKGKERHRQGLCVVGPLLCVRLGRDLNPRFSP
jgi:hypothetical protein